MRQVVILFLMISLTGCASAVNGAACTSLISGAGGLLQFCQTNQRIDITETGLGPQDHATRIVDDPSTLAALADHLKLNANMKRSRRLVARACVVGGANYVSLKASDLDRILQASRSGDQVARRF